jgi:hypothetical protein
MWFAQSGVSKHLRMFLVQNKGENKMRDLLRGALAGAAAWKFGGGLVSTILIFIVVFWLLGKC